MPISKEAIARMVKEWKDRGTKEYTDAALLKPDLTPDEKIHLVHVNQADRLDILKRVQQHTFEYIFKKNPETFFNPTFHYDWWIFPMHVPREWDWPLRNYDASITREEAKALLNDDTFVDIYLKSISMYIEALQTHGWNDYPVRYARMLHSLSLFMAAASDMPDSKDTHAHLFDQTLAATIYAEEKIAHLYPEDRLFQNGLIKAKRAINHYMDAQENRLSHP